MAMKTRKRFWKCFNHEMDIRHLHIPIHFFGRGLSSDKWLGYYTDIYLLGTNWDRCISKLFQTADEMHGFCFVLFLKEELVMFCVG